MNDDPVPTTGAPEDAAEAAGGPPGPAFALYLVRGILALVFGVAVLAFGEGLSNLATFTALYATVAGVFSLKWVHDQREAAGRRLGLAIAVLWLGAGLAVLLRDPLSGLVGEGVLLDVLGLVAVASGVVRLTGRFHDDQLAGDAPRPRYRYVAGPLDIALGLAVLLADDHSATSIRIALGVWGVVTATFLLADAMAVRRRSK